MKYLNIGQVINIHDEMLKVGGGKDGIRDFSLLHSAVERSRTSFGGKLLYPDIWFQAAALMQSLVKNHAFIDGNKRTALFSTLRFLNINSYDLLIITNEAVSFVLDVEVKNYSVKKIAKWLKKHSNKLS